jgi:hypothetical protein
MWQTAIFDTRRSGNDHALYDRFGSWLRESILVPAAGPISIIPKLAQFDVLFVASLE